MTAEIEATPRVWVGCLACYNDGRLTGQWIDGVEAGDLDTETLHAEEGVTVDPRYGPHEELWCMDLEGYGPALRGECSPTQAQEIAERLAEVDDNARDAFGAYLEHVGDLDEALESFEEAYAGEWDTERQFAEELADDVYGLARRANEGDALATYFDAEAFASDLFMGDYFSVPAPGGVYVFRSM